MYYENIHGNQLVAPWSHVMYIKYNCSLQIFQSSHISVTVYIQYMIHEWYRSCSA